METIGFVFNVIPPKNLNGPTDQPFLEPGHLNVLCGASEIKIFVGQLLRGVYPLSRLEQDIPVVDIEEIMSTSWSNDSVEWRKSDG